MGQMSWNMLSHHGGLVPTGLLVCPCLSPAWAEKEMYRNDLGFIGGWSIQPQNISPKPSIWQMLNSVTVATSLPWLGWGPTNYQDPSMRFAARIPHVPAPHRHHYAPSQCLAGQLLQCSQHLSCMSPLWNQQHSKARFASNINAVLSLPGTKTR